MKKLFTVIICLTVSGSAMIGCAEKTATTPVTPEQTSPKQKQEQKPTLGVPIPTLVYADDVKKYMRELLAAPLPADYVLPADILNAGSYDLAVAKVTEHFPEFTGLESEALLRAVKANPQVYQDMMLEARSVREYYFPGSQPKLSK